MRWCSILLLLMPLYAIGQERNDSDPQKTYIIEQRIEIIAELLEEEDIDFTTLFDDLSYFYEHPINLNGKVQEDLEQLLLLTDLQINNLLSHVEKNGRLLTIYELQAIDGYDLATIRNILPFVKVSSDIDSPHITFKEMMKNGKNELFIRYSRVLEEQEGFAPLCEDGTCNEDSILAASPNKRYLGDPTRLYTRYRFKYRNNVSWGITADKDAGEELFTGSQPNGFDFYSAHLFLKGFGKVKALAIGDYHAQFGQGLTFWSGLGFGKSSYVMTVKKNAIGLRPYTASDENLFMRGGAITLGFGHVEVTAMYSNKKIDANISVPDSLDNTEGTTVTSFQLTGLHATPGEIFDKDAIGETHMGGHIAYKKRQLNIGATAIRTEYDANLERSLQEYNQFDFNSNTNTLLGLDYNWVVGNFNLFGEASRSESGGMAFLNGALISLDPRLAFSLVQRNYQKDYQSQYSTAFADGSRNANEHGLFIGMEAKPAKNWTLAAYFDRFRSNWLRFQVDAPSNGYDGMAQLTYRPSKKLSMYGRIRHRVKPQNTTEDIEGIDFVTTKEQTNYRYNITYKVSDQVQLRNRIEMVDFKQGNNPTEKGYIAYQDVIYKALGKPYSFTFRYALFDTDSYNSRIYSYENDVLYYFSIPAYYFRGTRTYLTLRYKVVRGVDVWLRYSQWFYNNRTTISSGLNEIQGNTKSEFRAQVRFKF